MARTSIAAILGVKDEEQIIEANIEHLRLIGIEEIIVRDYSSTDLTVQILAGMERRGEIRVEYVDDLDPNGPDELTEVVRLAHSCDSEWVLVLDADEFPIVQEQDLRTHPELLSDDHDFVRLLRRNVASGSSGLKINLPPSGQSLEEFDVIPRPIKDYWRDLDIQRANSWIRANIEPRTIGRRSCIRNVWSGLHEMRGESTGLERHLTSRTMFMAHLPFSTFDRFERKVRNIEKVIEAHWQWFSGPVGHHWKRWRQCLLDGSLKAEFEAQFFDEASLEKLRAEGALCSAGEFLRMLQDGRL